METLLGLCIGVGLSAACGFRLLLPFFVISLGAMTGHLTLAEDMSWLGTPIAATTFGIAALLEILVYFVPWLDNMMDSIEVPVAIIAGTILTATFIPEMSPFLRWTLGAIAGGTVAGATGLMTTTTRFASTATTAGFGNSLVAFMELLSAAILSILAIAAPVIAMIVVIGLLFWIVKQMGKLVRVWQQRRMPGTSTP
jgi:hypothetical protein